MIEYITQAAMAVIVVVGAWLLHKVKQKEIRLQEFDRRLTAVEMHHAIFDVKLTGIRHDLQDIKESLRELTRKHMR